ncbi:MAG: hypothetical protein ABS910_00450 [Arthrobacter sp.]
MFDTPASAATLTLKDRETVQDRRVREANPVPARRAALGGSYVATFGRTQSATQHAPRPAAGFGYTARFDGAGQRNPVAPVDSYTAAFGPAGAAVTAASRPGGRYTDVNL